MRRLYVAVSGVPCGCPSGTRIVLTCRGAGRRGGRLVSGLCRSGRSSGAHIVLGIRGAGRRRRSGGLSARGPAVIGRATLALCTGRRAGRTGTVVTGGARGTGGSSLITGTRRTIDARRTAVTGTRRTIDARRTAVTGT
ncbi:hypothetical protein, partial [Janibacter corallicola]|uniref:hypothetical protein n=1 Tax=Janibacter corallicola TaxID=415212 RepID=UPI0012ED8534